MSLADLFGTRGPSIRWERALLFGAAMVSAKVAQFAIGYGVTRSDGAFSASWLRFGPPWELLLILAGQFAEIIVVVTVFRLIRREAVAIVVAVLVYGLVYTPVNLWLLSLALGPFSGSWMDVAVPRFATRAYYSLAFYGALSLGIRRIRVLFPALLVGALAGTVLGDLAAVFVQAATSPNAALTTNLDLVLWETPRALVLAAAFAVTLVGGLKISRALEGPRPERLPHARFVGSYLGLSCAGASIVWLTSTLVDLGRWPGRNFDLRAVRILPSGGGPVLFLACMGLLLCLMGGGVCLRLVYRAWAAIEHGSGRMTPRKAVSLFFVPIFNLYWMCALAARFRRDYNTLVERDAVPSSPLPATLFNLAPPFVVVLLVVTALAPFGAVAGVFAIAVVTRLMSRVCDAVNTLPGRSDAERLREERPREISGHALRPSTMAEDQ